MNSRYGLWMVCVCWIGLAGCANWQNRAGSNGPGSAATLQSAGPLGGPAVAGASGVAPGTTFNEPPPPMPPPPSDPNLNLAPLGSAPPPQKLNLSAATVADDGPVPDKMYNLESKPRSTAKASASSSGAGRSSTLSKLASKAGTSESASKNSGSGLSTVQRLQKSATASDTDASPKPAESEPQAAAKIVEPAPKAARTEAAQEAPVVDTTMLAQPVRKGSSDDSKGDSDKSKGPQSRVTPSRKPFEMNKAIIYPVSNPATERPVDITQFS